MIEIRFTCRSPSDGNQPGDRTDSDFPAGVPQLSGAVTAAGEGVGRLPQPGDLMHGAEH